MTGDVEEVLEVLVSCAEQGPDRAGAFEDVPHLPLVSVVTQKRAVKTRVCMLHQLDLDRLKKKEYEVKSFTTAMIYIDYELNTALTT